MPAAGRGHSPRQPARVHSPDAERRSRVARIRRAEVVNDDADDVDDPRERLPMNLKLRLIVMNFLQYFVWGAWLLTIGAWWFQNKHWSSTSFGAIFSTMGIASLFMPSVAGIIADKWINAERLYGMFQIVGAVILFLVPTIGNPDMLFWVMLVNMCFYMPTISLSIAVAYNALKREGMDVVRDYPPIRVWGTIGFIVATWTVSLLHLETSDGQFRIAAAASLALGLYAFTLPMAPPRLRGNDVRSLADRLGLTSFTLFRDRNMAVFLFFAMLLGAALQLTNAYGDTFLHDFAKLDQYKGLLAMRYPAIIISISQISETLFILTIPFFLKRFGIKAVMTMSMLAWVLRFGLFAYGNPAGGLWMIVLSCIVYGMAFDFFNISGSLFVEGQADPKIRASAQGLFMFMTNGVGAVLGSLIAGWMIDRFFTRHVCNDTLAICKDWHGIWLTFATYALIMAILFVPLFRHRHVRDADDLPARSGIGA
jgi:MFS transporter, NHS family, xanthosine permease